MCFCTSSRAASCCASSAAQPAARSASAVSATATSGAALRLLFARRVGATLIRRGLVRGRLGLAHPLLVGDLRDGALLDRLIRRLGDRFGLGLERLDVGLLGRAGRVLERLQRLL